MKMRTVRKATLVGGIATGALLFAGSAAQAADTDTDVEEAGLDAVQSAPELLGNLPVPTDSVPGLGAAQNLPVVGGITNPGAGAQTGDTAEQAIDHVDADDQIDAGQQGGNPVKDLLGGLGGGLPVPLPF